MPPATFTTPGRSPASRALATRSRPPALARIVAARAAAPASRCRPTKRPASRAPYPVAPRIRRHEEQGVTTPCSRPRRTLQADVPLRLDEPTALRLGSDGSYFHASPPRNRCHDFVRLSRHPGNEERSHTALWRPAAIHQRPHPPASVSSEGQRQAESRPDDYSLFCRHLTPPVVHRDLKSPVAHRHLPTEIRA